MLEEKMSKEEWLSEQRKDIGVESHALTCNELYRKLYSNNKIIVLPEFSLTRWIKQLSNKLDNYIKNIKVDFWVWKFDDVNATAYPLCIIDVISKGKNYQEDDLKMILNHMREHKCNIPIITVNNNGSNIDDVVNKINDLAA